MLIRCDASGDAARLTLSQRILVVLPKSNAVNMAPMLHPPLPKAILHINIHLCNPLISPNTTQEATSQRRHHPLARFPLSYRHSIRNLGNPEALTFRQLAVEGDDYRSQRPSLLFPNLQRFGRFLILASSLRFVQTGEFHPARFARVGGSDFHALGEETVAFPAELAAGEDACCGSGCG